MSAVHKDCGRECHRETRGYKSCEASGRGCELLGAVKHQPATHCSLALPGTYGHECGAPATQVGLRKSTETRSGIFYARRCDACAAVKGGENAGISEWQKFDASVHVNEFGTGL